MALTFEERLYHDGGLVAAEGSCIGRFTSVRWRDIAFVIDVAPTSPVENNEDKNIECDRSSLARLTALGHPIGRRDQTRSDGSLLSTLQLFHIL